MGFININFKIVGKPIVQLKPNRTQSHSEKKRHSKKKWRPKAKEDFITLPKNQNQQQKRRKRMHEKEITAQNPNRFFNTSFSIPLPEEKKKFTKHVVLY